MLKTIALMAALGAAAAFIPSGAGALPLAQDKAGLAATEGSVLLVREGCGRGFQWSERMRRCVRDTPRAHMRDRVQDVRRCGLGFHWSDRLRRCVR